MAKYNKDLARNNLCSNLSQAEFLIQTLRHLPENAPVMSMGRFLARPKFPNLPHRGRPMIYSVKEEFFSASIGFRHTSVRYLWIGPPRPRQL